MSTLAALIIKSLAGLLAAMLKTIGRKPDTACRTYAATATKRAERDIVMRARARAVQIQPLPSAARNVQNQ